MIVVRKSLNLTTNWPVRALVSPGKVFRTIAKLPERWSDRETQALGADPGIEPGTSRMLSERSTITPLSLEVYVYKKSKKNFDAKVKFLYCENKLKITKIGLISLK